MKKAEILPDDIIRTVCDVCGITQDMIKERTQRRDIAMAKQIAAHLLYRYAGTGIRETAQYVGLCRSSVYYPLFGKPVKDRCCGHALFRERFTEACRRLGVDTKPYLK